MTIHAFVFLSTHSHFLLSPSNAGQLALFMQFVNANVAKEAGRLYGWRERLWSRRYRSIVVVDEEAAHSRMRYILAHAAKEGLLASPASWPGPNCIAALTTGALLRGTWFNRSKEYLARQRGENTVPMKFATTFDVRLTSLSCLLDLSEDERQAYYRRVVGEIQGKAEADNKEMGRNPMTVADIIAQDPHSKPNSTDRSPAPFGHASNNDAKVMFRVAYCAFVDAYHSGTLRLRASAREIRDMFPLWSFPPRLPFTETA